MVALSTKKRGKNLLFKGSTPGAPRTQTTAIVVYVEHGETKTATFLGEGCHERASRKMHELSRRHCEIKSYTAS